MPTETTMATTPKPGNGQKFKFLSGAVKAFKRAAASGSGDELIISGVASSNVRDRMGDTMSTQCQASMLAQAKNLTMFGNHSYDVPEDVYGKCVNATLETNADVIDLVIEMQIAQSNPRAVKAWELINKDEVKLAFSVGGIIRDAEIDVENDDGSSWFPPLIINDLELLETSLVGIPANPRAYTRSFIEDIKKTAFKAAQRDPGVQKALLAAIGVKSVDEEFADLRDAETVNAEIAAIPTEEVKVKEPTAALSVELEEENPGVDAGTVLDKFRAALADLDSQRTAIVADITTKTSERDALVTEITALEEKAAKLKALPAGRQTKAYPDGSSPAAGVDLTKMTEVELRAHRKSLESGQPTQTINADDAR